MAVNSFTAKQLRVTFTLSNGATFAGTNNNILKLTGLRMAAQIRGAGMPAFPECDLAIFGMAQNDMQALSSLAFQTPANTPAMNRNDMQLEANSGGGWSTVFSGQILTAQIDYSGSPDVALRVNALVLGFDQINPAAVTSYTGATDVATIVSNLASQMNMNFENNGVNVVLNNPYFTGTLAEQLRSVQQQANIHIFPENNTIAIAPPGVPRDTSTFILSPTSGLVNYPVVDSRGFVYVKALYNAAFRFGGPLTIQGSDVVVDAKVPETFNTRANGNWMIGTLSHHLDSKKFENLWFSEMLLYPPGQTQPIS